MSGASVILFSAGINISSGVRSHPRIDEDAESIRPLINGRETIIIYNHQGDYFKGTAESTPWLASLLSERLQQHVSYFPECVGAAAQEFIARLPRGGIALMGNTRCYAQEQQNDSTFAGELAHPGDRLVIGGFSKLHRKNASNCAIKSLIPWCYSQGVMTQLQELERIHSVLYSNRPTILLLGGNKKEKLQFLFHHPRLRHVDRVIAGGAVLNSLLKARGVRVGKSDCFPLPANASLQLPLYIPETVIVSDVGGRMVRRPLPQIRDSDRIVDFIFQEEFLADITTPGACSFFAAGPLSLPQSQYAHAAYRELSRQGIEGLFMGGDTLTEIEIFSFKSSGGGAVLHFFSSGYDDIIFQETYGR
ncbi:phosphoglycerate kinase [Xenorhabdus bovienii]|uniref:phosphoglycerate kinase n=1 Tax=Xenorhabdus bovienii TaxID=40576 RepID=UPI0023B251CE|nr:phosphoglycerate kinase [Xenorhabdus bovienii]MDE9447140.1 phosphoglycerate kinase [Xenorhabdus bovienii]MDE9519317.1 phosphoglycerate kinase [Xenorhabdus bovienii]MDE9536412.1 phosphoglycerate kinase [Xenorhabdus bovienii]MDE9589592.1 phosphoglycerate kinase [Xenorhabdus bovienii]